MLFFKRPAFGRIYAFEVDGYGNRTRPAHQHYGRVGTGMIPMKKRGRTIAAPLFHRLCDSGAGTASLKS